MTEPQRAASFSWVLVHIVAAPAPPTNGVQHKQIIIMLINNRGWNQSRIKIFNWIRTREKIMRLRNVENPDRVGSGFLPDFIHKF
jgi:uncharacterized protein YggU (UPF0235/DUF167 family)